MNFSESFEALTDFKPFPWQEALYKRFMANDIPSSCAIPTGLGKTNVIAIWLIAYANGANVPRRLVYVVNRRTVVDQTTEEAVTLRNNCKKIGIEYLAISTLRGQFADNREWSADPSRPAIICGTVDMIGSRLLFSGYGCGFKTKPMHAGFLGQDALLIHDEAHLEPAFQKLIDSIQEEQRNGEKVDHNLWPKLNVMALSATTRTDQENIPIPFELTKDEQNPPDVLPYPLTEPIHHVWCRLKAKKRIQLKSTTPKNIADEIAKRALEYKNSQCAVVIYVQTIEDLNKIYSFLEKKISSDRVQQLTGTMRGKERDEMIQRPIFKRFLKGAEEGETVYLVCTSAGEVGIDITANHMICDLMPFDNMVQRFGRVHRYGVPIEHEACIDVFYPDTFDDKDALAPRRKKTLELLKSLNGDVSPLALMTKLVANEKKDAFSPTPTILPATDILFDAWAMTTIRGKMPGRPPVEPYLHGIREWEPPETHVAWREEIEILNDELLKRYKPEDLLEDYPLKPHELLRDRSDRVFDNLQILAEKYPNDLVWTVNEHNQVNPKSLGQLLLKDQKSRLKPAEIKKNVISQIRNTTIILPPSIGGLTKDGTLNGNTIYIESTKYDISDEWYNEKEQHRRIREWSDSRIDELPQGMRLIRTIDTNPDADEIETSEAETDRNHFWHWYIRPHSADDDLTKTSTKPVPLEIHINDVKRRMNNIIEEINLPPELKQALIVAARFHDLGKKREYWQRSIGNPNPSDWYAKSGKRWITREICPNYRHEFGSLLDIFDSKQEFSIEINQCSNEMKEVVLHLIAAHHGFARPHFPNENAYDPNHPESESNRVATEVIQRFARLQRKYGRWGLAYLESLLRAADYAASADPSTCVADEQEESS